MEKLIVSQSPFMAAACNCEAAGSNISGRAARLGEGTDSCRVSFQCSMANSVQAVGIGSGDVKATSRGETVSCPLPVDAATMSTVTPFLSTHPDSGTSSATRRLHRSGHRQDATTRSAGLAEPLARRQQLWNPWRCPGAAPPGPQCPLPWPGCRVRHALPRRFDLLAVRSDGTLLNLNNPVLVVHLPAVDRCSCR